MRPVFERIKKKFVQLLEVSHKKSFAEDEMDFGKFSMRQSFKKKPKLISIIEISKIGKQSYISNESAKQEKLQFNYEEKDGYVLNELKSTKSIERKETLALDSIGKRNLY
jgi:hypothetical protein